MQLRSDSLGQIIHEELPLLVAVVLSPRSLAELQLAEKTLPHVAVPVLPVPIIQAAEQAPGQAEMDQAAQANKG